MKTKFQKLIREEIANILKESTYPLHDEIAQEVGLYDAMERFVDETITLEKFPTDEDAYDALEDLMMEHIKKLRSSLSEPSFAR